jgi:sigma-B regulation protein RsbU (phosphoserine phosphatase)
MNPQDLSQNHRLATLAKLPRDLERSQSPAQTLRIVRRSFSETEGVVASVWVSTRNLPSGQYRVLGVEVGGEAERDPFSVQEAGSAVQSGGTLGAIIACGRPQLIEDVEWSSLEPSFSRSLSGFTSVIAMPLSTTHLPINWVLLARKPPLRFTVSNLEAAVERVALVEALLHNQILAAELARAHEQIDSEARQLGELQRALLPAAASLPSSAGLETAASYEPSGRAGGDVYDFFPLSDDHHDDNAKDQIRPVSWCVFIGDTAGHGLAASIVMAIVQAVLRARPAGVATAAALLTHANRQLCSRNIGGFVTAFLGVYDPEARRLSYANAGHPPPLHRRSAAIRIDTLNAVASYPLGIDAAEAFEEATVQLARGDTLLLYTDGIIEATGNARQDQFGIPRLTSMLRDGPDRPAELVDRVQQAVRSHHGGQAPKDDETLVAIRIL